MNRIPYFVLRSTYSICRAVGVGGYAPVKNISAQHTHTHRHIQQRMGGGRWLLGSIDRRIHPKRLGQHTPNRHRHIQQRMGGGR